MKFKILCLHKWAPAYWRYAFPDYKYCSKCGLTRQGTVKEQIDWAINTPYLEAHGHPDQLETLRLLRAKPKKAAKT